MTKPTESDKALRLSQLNAALANATREVEEITRAREEVNERIVLFEKRTDVSEKMHQLAMTKYVNLEPQWEFQTDPEYVSLQKELSEIEFYFKRVEMLQTLKNMKKTLDSYEEQIASQAKSAEDIRAQIAALGE